MKLKIEQIPDHLYDADGDLEAEALVCHLISALEFRSGYGKYQQSEPSNLDDGYRPRAQAGTFVTYDSKPMALLTYAVEVQSGVNSDEYPSLSSAVIPKYDDDMPLVFRKAGT